MLFRSQTQKPYYKYSKKEPYSMAQVLSLYKERNKNKLRHNGLSDLHLDFFLINILEENLDLKVQHNKIMTEK